MYTLKWYCTTEVMLLITPTKYSKVTNNRAARLLSFKIFSYQQGLIWTYTVVNSDIHIVEKKTYFQCFLMLFITTTSKRHCFYVFWAFYSFISVSFKTKMKLHLKIAYTFNTFTKKFLPTRLLGLTHSLNLNIISYLHGYLESTLIRHLRVLRFKAM